MAGAAFKNTWQERRAFSARIAVAGLLVVVLLGVLAYRLVQLQSVQHDYFVTRSDKNRMRVRPVIGVRGLIYDRNGVVLAENTTAYRLELIPEQIPDLQDTVARLSQILSISEHEKQRFFERVKHSAKFEQLPLKLNLDSDDLARFEVDRQQFPGVRVRAGLTRHYPLGKATAHIVGYVGGITARDLQRVNAEQYRGASYIGKSGIERQYESLLHGAPGSQLVEADALGRTLRELDYTRATPGKTLYLSLDSQLQLAARKALGELTGAAVALDVNNGEVLAMVSVPSYDPGFFIDGISHKRYSALTADPDRPLFQRAIQGQYPPGSTIKPMMALAGLDLGVFNQRSKVFCPGYYQLPDSSRKHRDWKRRGHGSMNTHEAITQSCDVYFYDLAHRLEIDRIHDFLQPFGLGHRSGIDIPNEGRGLLPSREWKLANRSQVWFPGETLNVGIGQGFMLMTPLQLALSTARIATNGHSARPHLLRKIHDNATGTTKDVPIHPLPKIELNNPDNWAFIRQAMEDVVHSPTGTARRIGRDAPYHLAGKTGTAQVAGLSQEDDQAPQLSDVPLHLRDHSLFIGYAPADNPQVAVAVIAEHSGSGSAVAAPIVRQILDVALGYGKDANNNDKAKP